MSRKPTIWEVLVSKLGRDPTHAEVTAEVRRILADVVPDRKRRAARRRRS